MRNFKLPSKEQINIIFASFSKKERLIFVGLLAVLFTSTILMLQSINKHFMVTVPKGGGEVAIGTIGAPRFINPILANSQADMDLVSLIYSGLLRKTANGDLAPDLASGYEMSENGLVYTFTLKDDLYFHDGKPLSADDILFTISKVKDGVIESPRKVYWDGISVEKINQKTVRFTGKQPHASFLENTTLGIMPAHIWGASPIELNEANVSPVGSGPYMIKSSGKQSSGIIDYYELVPFKKFALGAPYIKKITLRFYQNEDDLTRALLDKKVEEIGSITPLNAENLKEKGYRVESAVLGRVFGLFFNQNQNQLFINKTIVRAIDRGIDKEKIVREVLSGYGVVIDSPIPPHMRKYQKADSPDEKSSAARGSLLLELESDLAQDGWVKNQDGWLEKGGNKTAKKPGQLLQFSISTGNTPELTRAAHMVKEDLEALGMKVEVKTFEVGNLNQSVIRPRKYDVLLFGQIINQESDLFAFWHSSQRKDPGLNIAMYTNAKVDKILEDAFVTIDKAERVKKYIQFEEEIKKDMPAVFIYSPDFIYVAAKNIKNLKTDGLISPSDRYLSAHEWYINTENVWRIFAR